MTPSDFNNYVRSAPPPWPTRKSVSRLHPLSVLAGTKKMDGALAFAEFMYAPANNAKLMELCLDVIPSYPEILDVPGVKAWLANQPWAKVIRTSCTCHSGRRRRLYRPRLGVRSDRHAELPAGPYWQRDGETGHGQRAATGRGRLEPLVQVVALTGATQSVRKPGRECGPATVCVGA